MLTFLLVEGVSIGAELVGDDGVQSTLNQAKYYRDNGRLAEARSELDTWLRCHGNQDNFHILAALARVQFEQLDFDNASMTWMKLQGLSEPEEVAPWVSFFAEKWPNLVGGLEIKGDGRPVLFTLERAGLVADAELTKAFLEREKRVLKRLTNRVFYLPAGRYRIDSAYIDVVADSIAEVSVSELKMGPEAYERARDYPDSYSFVSEVRTCTSSSMFSDSPKPTNFFRKTWPWWVGGIVVVGTAVGIAAMISPEDNYVIDFQRDGR